MLGNTCYQSLEAVISLGDIGNVSCLLWRHRNSLYWEWSCKDWWRLL